MNTSSSTTGRTASPPGKAASKTTTATTERGLWSALEHDKFLTALKMYPDGPWRAIAEFVGSRSARQVQTHAQKYYEKVSRRVRGLRKDRRRVARAEHRLDDDMAGLCHDVSSFAAQHQSSRASASPNNNVSHTSSSVNSYSTGASDTNSASTLHSRRELQVLAMRHRCRHDSFDVKLEHMRLSDADASTDADTEAGTGSLSESLELSELHIETQYTTVAAAAATTTTNYNTDSDSDSSLSTLDSDYLDYLLQILESRDYDDDESIIGGHLL